jgi:hypothetical protein
MISLSDIEQDLALAIKTKNRLLADTLRGLKTRLENERIAKLSAGGGSQPEADQPLAGAKTTGGKNLSEEEIFAIVKNEIKRRKEAAESFQTGNRLELADKELKEASFLEKYLPPQMSEEQIVILIEKVIAENNFSTKDFGKAMGILKDQAGSAADGAVLAKLLKEKLK